MIAKLENKINLIVSILFVLASFGCNNEKANSYTKVEVYCWCFSHIPNEEAKNGNYPDNGSCETPSAMRSSFLINSQYFFDSTTNTTVIKALKKTIFEKKSTSEKSEESYADARFLILFKKSDSEADTLVYSYPNELYLNSKSIYKYSFNVIDSVRGILGKEKIVCLSH